MAMKWNWRKLGYGSGAVVAAISTIFALDQSGKGNNVTLPQKDEHIHRKKSVTNTDRGFDVVGAAPLLNRNEMLEDAIHKSRQLCKRVKDQLGMPGLTVGVTVNGRMVWQEGFGFSNIENQVRMKPESIMRIASISKTMTMVMLAKLMEDGKIDIDKPIQTYLPTYPEKCVDGEKVVITTRHLLSHLSGIRHYTKKETNTENENPQDENVRKSPKAKDGNKADANSKDKKKRKKDEDDEMSLAEYFLKDKFSSVEDSMKLFKDDELFHKPGSKYMYTTHGWTVVSAIVEKLTETEFPKHSRRMFDYWGLKNTFLDIHEPIIYNRANYYLRKKDGVIENAPYVDNSYKWAGGGFLSNVSDLTQFANMLLFSVQTPEGVITMCDKGLPKVPFLKQSTINKMWTGDPTTASPDSDSLYALGFRVGEPLRTCMFCKERDLRTVFHSGAAVGASSILLMAFPAQLTPNKRCDNSNEGEVKGVAVAMITNLTSIGLTKTAQEIANNFRGLI